MAKEALSITLAADNVTWLKARSRAVGARGVSELIDHLVTDARTKTPGGVVKSVVGTIDIDASDPLLMGADDVLREMFDASLARPVVVKERRSAYAGAKRKPRRG